MRTLILICVGIVLAILSQRLSPTAYRWRVALSFLFGWALVVAWNLASGLWHGYSLREELPIQLVIFAIPVALAIVHALVLPRR